MSLEIELESIKELAVSEFNKSKGTELTVDGVDMMINRPAGKELAVLFFVTKAAGDHLRFQYELMDFGTSTQTKPFELRVFENMTEGNLNSEVFSSRLVLHKDNFKKISNYLNSETYKDFLSRKPFLFTVSDKTITLKNSLTLKFQR